MFFALTFICAGALAVPQAPRPIYDLKLADELFDQFIVDFHKQYESEAQKQRRFEIFKDKLRYINDKNSDPTESAEFGITFFTDIERDEFRGVNGFSELDLPKDEKNKLVNVSSEMLMKSKSSLPVDFYLPENFNWVDHNVVTPVKNQGRCGSCWAFSTTGVFEGAFAMKHKKLVSLSEQQLIDCSDNCACCGGYTIIAAHHVLEAGGIESDSSYPYMATRNKCRLNHDHVVAKVGHITRLNLQDEEALRELLYTSGPISIGVHSSSLSHSYGGIIMNCEKGDLDHYVLLVGFGTSSDGIKYWIIKNSWGTDIGDKGYHKVVRGRNSCGMMNSEAMSVTTL